MSRLLFGVVLIGLGLLPAVGCNKGKDAPPTKTTGMPGTPAAPAAPKEMKPEFTASSEATAKEFLTDEKAARAKYEGKVIAIEGPVAQMVSKDIINVAGAKKDEKDFLGSSFNCVLQPSDMVKGQGVSPGQKVKVVGRVNGVIVGIVTLTDCTLTELEPSKLLKISAPDLAKEYTKDAAASTKKYANQDVVVNGEVLDTFMKDGFSYLRLKGDGKANVTVTVAAGESAQKGQQAVVRGNFSSAEFMDNEVKIQMGKVLDAK